MIQDYSIWEYEVFKDLWDVCIIGSGINGLSAGISILEKQAGAKVLIVDRAFIPLGASTRNAGFSCFGSPTEILDDIHSMGEQAAIELVRQRWQGLQLLKSRLENSHAQYESLGGYELYHEDDYERIASQLPYLNNLLKEVIHKEFAFEEKEIPEGIKGFSHAVYNPYEGQLHPGFMIDHLTKMFIRLGGKIWNGYHVDQLEEKKDKVVLCNKLSIPVESKKVIVSTNAFVGTLIPEIDVYGARNHVIVTEPIPGLPWKGCFHYDKGFYYFRNIGSRILLGGGRNADLVNENTDEFGSNQKIVEILENFLFEHLAERSTSIQFRWSGIIALGKQKTPIVQALSPRIFAGVRCSGMGIALASLIGEELAGLVLQQ